MYFTDKTDLNIAYKEIIFSRMQLKISEEHQKRNTMKMTDSLKI